MRKTTLNFLAVALLVGLAGCKPDADKVLELSNALPVGCKFTNIENYGSIDLLVVVVCDGHSVTSTSVQDTRTTGKVTTTDIGQTIVVDGN